MRFRCFSWALLLGGLMAASAAEPANQLSDAEKQADWQLLFDGKTVQGWRSVNKPAFPATQWVIEDGWLHCRGKNGGDIVTERMYDQFELTWEWKLASGGNSGVKYFVVASRGASIGHEYQLIDDDRHGDSKLAEGKRVTASYYDVLKPQTKTLVNAPGEVNHSRILVRGNLVEHWLNGQKVLAYELGSPAVLEAVSASKFKTTKDFGTLQKGRILLQDHQSEVWFRNIKIRDLSEK